MSIVPLEFDARDERKGIVEIQVTSWNYVPQSKTYVITVVDYGITKIMAPTGGVLPDGTPVMEEIENREAIRTANVYYTVDQFNQKFAAVGKDIGSAGDFTEQFEDFLDEFMLFLAEESPKYGSTGNEWVKIPEPTTTTTTTEVPTTTTSTTTIEETTTTTTTI